MLLQSLWNPFRDWNAELPEKLNVEQVSFKASETLLGIETIYANRIAEVDLGFKASETLLGIETFPKKIDSIYPR